MSSGNKQTEGSPLWKRAIFGIYMALLILIGGVVMLVPGIILGIRELVRQHAHIHTYHDMLPAIFTFFTGMGLWPPMHAFTAFVLIASGAFVILKIREIP